ncbi:MAG TPA: response regulator [Alphaproteobacteria bacterium]|nr:response regulator [Alphaproteobacteria bacterium]
MTEDKVNILVVDDQPAKLLSYEVMLNNLGENLLKANSANEALEHLLRNDVAVVLIDVCMPDLDGFELASMIRAHPRFERTALIFVSAIHLTDLDRVRGYRAGAVDYVPVPVVPELLQAKVKVFIELYRKSRQLEALNGQLEQRVAERTAELERINAELERRVEERTQEREAAMAQIHEMQKLESLGKLTGGVAHDFNNLLMAVLGNLRLLRKRLMDDPRLLRLIDGAIEGAERGATLTKRMLAFARRQELKPETIDVGELVDGMTEMLRRSLGPTIEIRTEFHRSLAPVCVDPNQLELALLNLGLNARDAMPLGGKLTISARPESVRAGNTRGMISGEYTCIAVTDAGTGMDDATIKRAAEPFFTTKGVGKGTGLGLSMVHGFTAQSGGHMEIKSGVGAGTTVELWLPTAEPTGRPEAPPAQPQAAPGLRRPCRILIVDDDALIAEGTAAIVEDLGHAPIQVLSGMSALDLLRADPGIDLVLTDHAMPTMTGVELARQVRQFRPNMPIILATGYAELPGGDDLGLPRLNKPYKPEELAAAIQRLMDGSSSNVVSIDSARRA